MKRILLALALMFAPSVASAQSGNWLPGVFTLAAGPDNLDANLPASAWAYYEAWVSDRTGGAGFMVSNGTAWVSDQGPPGTAGTNGTNGTNGAPGAAATLAVGTITTGAPGSSASCTNGGTSSAAILNCAFPRGDTGATGSTGPAGPSTIGAPNSRSVSLATAYQATDNTKPSLVNVNLTSTASLSLSGGTTNAADVVIGSTNAVASGTGTLICRYGNSNTGALTVGLALSTISAVPCSFHLPAGWWFAVRQISGTVTVTSTFDQSVG